MKTGRGVKQHFLRTSSYEGYTNESLSDSLCFAMCHSSLRSCKLWPGANRTATVGQLPASWPAHHQFGQPECPFEHSDHLQGRTGISFHLRSHLRQFFLASRFFSPPISKLVAHQRCHMRSSLYLLQ